MLLSLSIYLILLGHFPLTRRWYHENKRILFIHHGICITYLSIRTNDTSYKTSLIKDIKIV